MPKRPAPEPAAAAASDRFQGEQTMEPGGAVHQRSSAEQHALTTNHGLPIADNQNSLHAYERGPTLLEDFILREKITHFDHERIPERIVHARGSAAHGSFELTESLAAYTTAGVLTEVGKKTPVFVRFSTVAGGAGSIDTPRDVRGFAVKFYTDQGNWDLVGNNIPVFFIQDAIKFPDLVHAVKMEPDRGFPQAASAHDTFWDFVSLMPESLHMIMWAMSDRTLPRSLRMIEGFGAHSFRLIDAQGRGTFVKFHWRPALGLQSTLWDEAVKLAGADPDFHRRDLFEAIQAGDFPSWDLCVQLFDEDQAATFPFDHLDSTKLVLEELVPLKKIGRMTLDRWPDNFFAETEQVAFCPSHLLPGMDFSEDPLLQGRLHSYLDTQLSRLGSANFHQLPINAPRCPFANHQRDGHAQMRRPVGRVAYEPNTLAADAPREVAGGFASAPVPVLPLAGRAPVKARLRPESFADHYSQARQFFLSQTALEQAHMASALVFELSKVEHLHIRQAVVGHLRHIEEALAQRVGDGLALAELPPAPRTAAPVQDLAPSAALGLAAKTEPSLQGRSVGILVADGTDAALVAEVQRAVAAQGGRCKLIAPHIGGFLPGGKGRTSGERIAADGQLAGTPSVLFDAVVLALAPAAVAELVGESAAIDFVRDAFGHLKAIGHTVAAQALLDKAGVEADEAVVELGGQGGKMGEAGPAGNGGEAGQKGQKGQKGDSALEKFIAAAKTRQWAREPSVRKLA